MEAGTAKLVGTDVKRIVSSVCELVEDRGSYNKMAYAVNPYGDGKAAIKIANILEKKL